MLLNSSIFLSDDGSSYLTMVNFMKTAPFIVVLELVLIALPIIFHGIYGIYIVYLAKNNAFQYKYLRNWGFYLQRITAIIMLIFLIWHVYTLRLTHHVPEDIMATLVGYLHNPLFLALYIIGVVASIYHLSNGLFTFCITWGICVGERAQKIFSICAMIIFAAISILAVGILIKLSLLPL